MNRWIVKPILRVTTWIKRNPLLALVLAVLLWILPSPLTVLNWFTNWAVSAVARFSVAGAQKIGEVLTVAGNWLAAKSGRCFWVGFAIMPFLPLPGAALMYWCAIQALKPAPKLTIAKAPEPPKVKEKPIFPEFKPYETDNPFGLPI